MEPLKAGTLLKGKYKIEKHRYIGGNSYIYEGYDGNKKILIKEHLYNHEEYQLERNEDQSILAGELWYRKNKRLAKKEDDNNTLLNNAGYPYFICTNDLFEENNTWYSISPNPIGIGFNEAKISSVKSLYELTIQLIKGIIQLHQLGYYHLDLSLGNIIKIDDERMHFIDLGSMQEANHIEADYLSTSLYSPPEITQPDKINESSDQYSIGKIMIELANKVEEPFFKVEKDIYIQYATKACSVIQTDRYVSLNRLKDLLSKHLSEFDPSKTKQFIERRIMKEENKESENKNVRYYYKNRNQYFVGRKNEKETIHQFHNSDDSFALMLIQGSGGSGKSALMYNYVLEAIHDEIDDQFENIVFEPWHYAFLKFSDLNHVEVEDLFHLGYHLFLVVDYITTASLSEITRFLRKVRDVKDGGRYRVRIILLERNQYLLDKIAEDPALESMQDVLNHKIELHPLEDDQIKEVIVSYGKDLDKGQVDLVLKRLGKKSRVLYALIYTDMIKDQVKESSPLKYVYQREINKLKEYTDDDRRKVRILSEWLTKATLAGKISYKEAKIEKIDKEERYEYVSLLDGSNDEISGIIPDLIGEYFTIQHLEKYVEDDEISEFLSPLWEKDPDSLVTNLIHIMQDFKYEPLIKAAFKAPDLEDERIYLAYYRFLSYAIYETQYATIANKMLNMHYEWIVKGDTLYGYNGNHSKVVIPDHIKKIKRFDNEKVKEIDFNEVEEIAPHCFEDYHALEKVIMKKVKVIEEATFNNCRNLKWVYLNGGIERIEDKAFRGSAIEYFYFPYHLKKIGKFAFNGCEQLKVIKVNKALEIIQKNAFENCHIDLEQLVFYERLKKIEKKAFHHALQVERLTIMGSTILSNKTFYGSLIKELTIKKDIDKIPNNCFGDCHLEKVNMEGKINTIERFAFYGNASLNPRTTLTKKTNKNIEKVEDTITFRLNQETRKQLRDPKIKNRIETLIVEKDIERILSQEFKDCIALKNVELGENVTYIGVEAFKNTAIRKLKCPKQLKVIEDGAYANSRIESIEWNQTIERIGNNFKRYPLHIPKEGAFENCMIKELKLPGSIVSLGKNSFKENHQLQKADLSECKLTILETSLFERCTSLKEVKLPDNVEVIKDQCFISCDLQAITFPYRLSTIGKNSFSYCSIKELALFDHIRVIYEEAFSNNPIEQIILSRSIDLEGDMMDWHNYHLKQLTIIDEKINDVERLNNYCTLHEIPYNFKEDSIVIDSKGKCFNDLLAIYHQEDSNSLAKIYEYVGIKND